MHKQEKTCVRHIGLHTVSSSPVDTLRSTSLPAHKALENTPVAQRLMSPSLTKLEYIEILKIWFSIWAPLENMINERKPQHIARKMAPIRRAHKIQIDLKKLCVTNVSMLTQNRLPFQLDHSHAWLGVAYVLKGSALGAKVIEKHLQTTLNIDASTGAAFFHTTNDTIAWPDWIKWLNNELNNDIDNSEAHEQTPAKNLEQTIDATNCAFSFIKDAFNRLDTFNRQALVHG